MAHRNETIGEISMNELEKKNTAVDRAADQVKTAADRVATKATDTIASAKSAVTETVDTIAERTHAATDWASHKYDAVSEAPSALVESGAEYIKTRPYTAIGIAVVVGYILGRLQR